MEGGESYCINEEVVGIRIFENGALVLKQVDN